MNAVQEDELMLKLYYGYVFHFINKHFVHYGSGEVHSIFEVSAFFQLFEKVGCRHISLRLNFNGIKNWRKTRRLASPHKIKWFMLFCLY